MLFSSNLFALVGSGHQAQFSPRYLKIFNAITDKMMCEFSYSSAISSVKMNKSRMIVATEGKLHIIDWKKMESIHVLDAPKNAAGLMALSPDENKCFLAFPNREDKGEVMLYDALNLQSVKPFQVHDSPIRMLTFNRDGSLLATASNKGTIVRIFSVPAGEKKLTLRRGATAATIKSMAFSPSSTRFCLASDSSTVQIFNLVAPKPVEKPSIFSTALATATSYIAAVVPDLIEPEREFATITLRDTYAFLVVGFSSDDVVLVATSSGLLLRYEIPAEGGECKVAGEQPLRPNVIEPSQSGSDLSQSMIGGKFSDFVFDAESKDDESERPSPAKEKGPLALSPPAGKSPATLAQVVQPERKPSSSKISK